MENELERLFSSSWAGRNDDGMSGICTSLIARDDVGVLTEMINDLPFSLVAPLGTKNNLNRHTSR